MRLPSNVLSLFLFVILCQLNFIRDTSLNELVISTLRNGNVTNSAALRIILRVVVNNRSLYEVVTTGYCDSKARRGNCLLCPVFRFALFTHDVHSFVACKVSV